MSKQTSHSGSAGFRWLRSLLEFRHRNPAARFISTLLAFATATLLVVAGVPTPAQAVHDTGKFELDGNIAHDGNATWDWGNLFNAAGDRTVTPDPNNGPLLASSFVSDGAKPDNSYFTSNKDIQPIASGQQHWGCDPINNPLAKDDLLNAYAALVQVPADAPDNAGHTVLYLGSERGSNNGTSYAGFWLLKNSNVGCTGTANFSGSHTNGDILVVSDYTNGGGTQDVSVYKWVGDDATGGLVLQSTGGVCDGATTDNVCAIANADTITSTWSPTSHAPNTFVEAGLDLNVLLGSDGGCFTTFMAETRSSDQLTATLKDFARGQFNTCPPAPMTTQATPGGSTVAPGTAQHDVATLTAVGGRPVPTGSVKFFLCQPADVTAAGCPAGSGTQVGDSIPVASGSAASANTSDDTTTGKYCWRAEYTPDTTGGRYYVASSHTNSTTECFTVVHASPTITTQISPPAPGAGEDPLGLGFTTLGDTATLHDFVPGTVTGETVDFNLYDVTADPGCTGSAVFHTTGTLNASGVATTSATYTPTAAHTYTWIASYGGNSYNDPIAGTCADAHESATIVGAQIDVAKSANPAGPVSAGSTIGFDITVSNAGTVPATGVTVSDNLPAKATGNASGDLDWSLSPAYTGCSITGAVGSQVLSCSLGTVAGTSSLPAIHVQSATTPVDCGVVSNKATVATTNGTGGDSDVASVTVQCPGLSLTKTADAASVDAGSQIGFTVTASNSNAAGTGTATGVVIDDPLPAGSGVDWSIASGPANCSVTGSVGSQTLHCTAVDLAPGASEAVHVVSGTAFASCKAYPNTASATATNHGSLTASASTTVLCPDVSITKTADAASVDAGAQIGFTITASNSDAAGTGAATDVSIDDPLPSGSGVSWSIESGPENCSIQGSAPSQTLHCSPVGLAPGASESVHVVSGTAFASCKAYPNTASLAATNHPSLTASATTTVLCPALSITKTADAASVNAGAQIGFTVTASNKAGSGVGTATGVVVDDPLPSGSGVSWSIASGSANCSITGSAPSQTLHCTAVTLAPGESESVHVVSGTTSASCLAYPNTASLTATNHPSLTASATTTVANCVIVSPPEQQHPNVLPNTGGPDRWVFPAGLALLIAGATLVLGDRRRRRRS